MKTFAILALLVAAACAQYFCPESEEQFQCLETKPNTAFCMTDTTWVCGKCAVKRNACFGSAKQARYESVCTNAGNPKISC